MKRLHSPSLSGSKKPGRSRVPQTQRDGFIEAARQVGADEDAAAFKAKLAQIARQKPKCDVPEPSKERDE